MSYTIDTASGIVTRTSDGVQVAPAQSTSDPAYIEYAAWVAAGNQPTYVEHPVVEPVPKITKFAFRNRFTPQEKIMIELASLDDPTSPMPQRQAAAGLRVYLKDLENAMFIDLTRTDIQAGIQQLVLVGILTQERANAILNDPIQLFEAV